MPRRSLILPSLALLVLLGFSLTGWAANSGRRTADASLRMRGLVLSGSVKGLYPGGVGKLRVVVRNRFGFRLRVTRVTVTAKNANRGCRKQAVAFGRFRGRLNVPARRARSVTLKVSMARTAPNACRRATFRLAFHAKAVRP
jgi:hypothetical protein